jgi:hypothetical protein
MEWTCQGEHGAQRRKPCAEPIDTQWHAAAQGSRAIALRPTRPALTTAQIAAALTYTADPQRSERTRAAVIDTHE